MDTIVREGAWGDGELWRNDYERFMRLFRGRNDVIAERVDGEYVPRTGAGMTLERFRDHVRMAKTYALYNKDDAGGVSFGLFDLDILPRNQGWDRLVAAMDGKKQETQRVIKTLMEMGLDRKHMLAEFPTVGFHLFIFFDAPVQASLLKSFMRFVLNESGLDKVPLYPKKVGEEAPWGDLVQLPLRLNLNTQRRSNFVRDLDSFDPLNYATEPDFGVLDQVTLIKAEWLQAQVSKYNL